MSNSGLKFRNQRHYFESNYKDRETADLIEEQTQMWKNIRSVPQQKSVWPAEIVEIFNYN